MSSIEPRVQSPIRVGVIGATPARGWGTTAHLPALAALRGVPGHRRVHHPAEHRPGHRGGLRDSPCLRGRRRTGVLPGRGRRCRHGQGPRARPADPRRAGGRQARVFGVAARHRPQPGGPAGRAGRGQRGASHRRAAGLPGAGRAVRPGADRKRGHRTAADRGRGGRRRPGRAARPRRPTCTPPMWPPGPRCSASPPATCWPPWPVRSASSATLSAVVALVNTETTVIETGQTVPVTAPDQVVRGRAARGRRGGVRHRPGRIGAGHARASTCASWAPKPPWWSAPATPGGIHITDWAITLVNRDGSAEDLPVPARFTSAARGRAGRAAEKHRPAVSRVRPGHHQQQPGRARLRRRRPAPPVAGEDSASLGHRGPPGRGRLGGHERSARPAHRRMRRSDPAPAGRSGRPRRSAHAASCSCSSPRCGPPWKPRPGSGWPRPRSACPSSSPSCRTARSAGVS